MFGEAVAAIQQAADAAGAFVTRLTGWRRLLLAAGAGAASALAFAPLGLFPLFLIGIAVLVLLIDGAASAAHPVRSAALAGWAFGFGQFFVGLYWIGYAFLVDADEHAWQLPFALVLFPAGLALFQAGACAAAAALWRRGPARIFLLAACYALAEWLRGHILTGFPWNLPAYAWEASLGMLQTTAIVGAYGLSLLTLALGASLALFAARDEPRERWLPAALTGLFVILWGAGLLRLAIVAPADVPGVRLRIVQPNVPQHEQYALQYRARNWERLILLSIQPTRQEPTHIIWPEAAPPFLLDREPGALDNIARLTAKGRVLMTGAVRDDVGPGGEQVFHNSFYVFGRAGAVEAVYDKSHLVPFGEYLPMPQLLHALGLSKIVNMPDGFRAGDGPRAVGVPGAPDASPLICYEIVFPGAVTGARRPGWFINVSDDSWFGPPSSSGPYQHLLTARVRAIEEGIPVVRAANTGISAIIDPLGQTRALLGAGEIGVLDGNLPSALAPTLYARAGDLFFWLLLTASFAAGLLAKRSTGAGRRFE